MQTLSNLIQLERYLMNLTWVAALLTVEAGCAFRSYLETEWGYDQPQLRQQLQGYLTILLIFTSGLLMLARDFVADQYASSDFFTPGDTFDSASVAIETASHLLSHQSDLLIDIDNTLEPYI